MEGSRHLRSTGERFHQELKIRQAEGRLLKSEVCNQSAWSRDQDVDWQVRECPYFAWHGGFAGCQASPQTNGR